MQTTQLGEEVRRLRLESGTTLRGLAATLQVSAAHLSDIEHGRRRPSEKLLRAISHELRTVGATFATFEELVTGIDPEMRDWAASTPGIRKLLRKIKESGLQPNELLRVLDKAVRQKKTAKRVKARP